jgi:hypothetical protein
MESRCRGLPPKYPFCARGGHSGALTGFQIPDGTPEVPVDRDGRLSACPVPGGGKENQTLPTMRNWPTLALLSVKPMVSRFADTYFEIGWAIYPHIGFALMCPLEALRDLSNAAGAFRHLRLICIAIIDLLIVVGHVALLGNRYNQDPQVTECIGINMTQRIAS